MTVEERLQGEGPKRILAIDGGGVRGMVALGILEQIESTLGNRTQREGFRLCDYFDLIAGTSTGAIIAVALSLGMSVSEIIQLYDQLAPDVFKKSRTRRVVEKVPKSKVALSAFAKFRRTPLLKALEKEFAPHANGNTDIKLDDPHLRTGLLIFVQRLMPKGHVWAVLNNPRHRFFKKNNGYSLIQWVRASTAAPSFFEPERLRMGDGKDDSWFIDGGVSPFNNPALGALMVATLSGFQLKWALGEDKLMVVSVGTGFRNERVAPTRMHAKLYVPAMNSLMEECNWLTQAMLQWLSNSPTPWKIHGGTESLGADLLGGSPSIAYLRYNVELGRRSVRSRSGREVIKYLKDAELESLNRMDVPQNRARLLEIGRIVGERDVRPDHFRAVFDVR